MPLMLLTLFTLLIHLMLDAVDDNVSMNAKPKQAQTALEQLQLKTSHCHACPRSPLRIQVGHDKQKIFYKMSPTPPSATFFAQWHTKSAAASRAASLPQLPKSLSSVPSQAGSFPQAEMPMRPLPIQYGQSLVFTGESSFQGLLGGAEFRLLQYGPRFSVSISLQGTVSLNCLQVP